MPKLAFDRHFFAHVNAARESETGKRSRLLGLIERALCKPVVVWPLAAIEHFVSFVLALPIPLYGWLVFRILNSMPGLPSMIGVYFRALYYRRKLGLMEPNVIIEADVVFANPKTVELQEFSFIDRRVMIMSKTTKIGRRVHIAPNVFVSGGGDFIAENYCCVATNSSIITSTEVLKDGARCSGPMVKPEQRNVTRGFVYLGKDSFVGAHALILTNVRIAEGSVVGGGAVIAADTKPWGIYTLPKSVKVADRQQVKFD